MMKKVFAYGVLFLAVAASIGCGINGPLPVVTDPAPSGPILGAEAPCTGNTYTFENKNSYPVWLAEGYQGAGDIGDNTIAPPGDKWMMAAGDSVSLCMPDKMDGAILAAHGMRLRGCVPQRQGLQGLPSYQ